MAKTDPLIRWETEALRESAERRRRSGAEGAEPSPLHKKAAWVTLRDAHFATGLPIETLRKWARRRHVPSDLRKTEFGERRFVDLAAVEDRARNLGRPLRPVPPEQRETPTPPASNVAPEQVDVPTPTVVDLRDQLPPPTDDGEPATETVVAAGAEFEAVEPDADDEAVSPDAREPAGARAGDDEETPPETMIVPIAAWDRMLMQLGNLHEAGQHLADARERAAKAETEAEFLRERLAELRTQLDPPAVPTQVEPRANEEDPPEKLWRYVLKGWRARSR
jgi:hypothetical protein